MTEKALLSKREQYIYDILSKREEVDLEYLLTRIRLREKKPLLLASSVNMSIKSLGYKLRDAVIIRVSGIGRGNKGRYKLIKGVEK